MDKVIKQVVRTIFTVIAIAFGIYYISTLSVFKDQLQVADTLTSFQKICIEIIFAIIFSLIYFYIYSRVVKRTGELSLEMTQEDNKTLSKFRVFIFGILGFLLGMALALIMTSIYKEIQVPYIYIGVVVLVVTYTLIGFVISIITNKIREFINFGGNKKSTSIIAKKRKSFYENPKILDTNVIIDGRVVDIIKSGFLEGTIIIPDFVLLELQYISDSSDDLKRKRGRRGLDVLNIIRQKFGIQMYDSKGDESIAEIPEVDIKLLKLAQIIGGKVVTNDYNLNKVAHIWEVDVLNINELSNLLRPLVVQGDEMNVYLVKEGKEREQALGYLDDGTMIVVEDGKSLIGNEVTVEVTSILQTSAGRMIFAKTIKRGDGS